MLRIPAPFDFGQNRGRGGVPLVKQSDLHFLEILACNTGYIHINTHGNKPNADGIYSWNEDYTIATRNDGGFALACCTEWNVWRIVMDLNNPCNAIISINQDNSGCAQEGLFGSMTGYYYHGENGWNKVEKSDIPLVSCGNSGIHFHFCFFENYFVLLVIKSPTCK